MIDYQGGSMMLEPQDPKGFVEAITPQLADVLAGEMSESPTHQVFMRLKAMTKLQVQTLLGTLQNMPQATYKINLIAPDGKRETIEGESNSAKIADENDINDIIIDDERSLPPVQKPAA